MLNRIFLFCIFLFIAYANSLHSPFMLDDFGFFNRFKQQSFESLLAPESGRSYYRPLANVMPWLEWKMFREDAGSYHAANIVLLAAAGLMIYLLMASVFNPAVGWAVALLLTIHPINGLIVNYITASVFAVQVICMAASIFFIQRYFLSCIFFILALMCHETAVLLPAYAALILSIKERNLKILWRETMPLWLTLAGYLVLRYFCVPLNNSLVSSLASVNPSYWQMLTTILELGGWYISKLLLPFNIFLMWSVPFAKAGTGGYLYLSAFVIALSVAGVYVFKKIPGFWQMTLWFFIGFLPLFLAAYATPHMGALVEPHWFVFASIGFFTSIVLLLHHFWRDKPVVFGCIVGGLVAVLLVCTWRNNNLWSNEKKYYEAWLEENPDFTAVHYFLATTYLREKEYGKAREHLNKSILGRQKDWMVYFELAKIDLTQRDYVKAKEHLGKAFQLNPGNADILNAIAVMFFAQDRLDDAEQWLQRAILTDERNLEPRMNLALLYIRKKDKEKAVEECRKVLRIKPDFASAQECVASYKNSGAGVGGQSQK